MLTRLLLFAALTLSSFACTPLSEGARPEVQQPGSLEGQANVKCPPNKLVSNLLLNGSTNRIVWEDFLRKVRGNELVEEFLRDWERGDKYTLQQIECSTAADPKLFSMDITTPQFGSVLIETIIHEAEITAFAFIPLSHLYIETTAQ